MTGLIIYIHKYTFATHSVSTHNKVYVKCQAISISAKTVRNSVPWRVDYAVGNRASNMMASWLLAACHSRTDRFYS